MSHVSETSEISTKMHVDHHEHEHDHHHHHMPHHDEDYDATTEYFNAYPNRWSKIRSVIREPAAEFLGTMILIIFGTAVDCQVVLGGSTKVSASPKGDYLSLNFGWAIGTGLGVWVAGGISGGHINPAVTLCQAVFRGFPWKKVPYFILAQLLGALCGSAVVYANYFHAIDLFEGGRGIRTVPGTASLFSTYAADYMTSVSCFFDEFVGTAVLLIVVLAITDRHNGPPPNGLVPLVLFLLVLGIGAALGMQTGYAINPARDLGPRLMTSMVGYGRDVFTFRNQYWLWCPILGSISGGLTGTLVYDAFLFTGGESIFNKPNAAARAHHARGERGAREKLPGGTERIERMRPRGDSLV